MIHKTSDDKLFIRLFPGEDFLQSLENACREHQVTTGILVSAIGMLEHAELRTFRGKGQYHSQSYPAPMELASATGTIACQPDGSYVCHIHAVLAGHDMTAVAGHLGGGRAAVTNELVLLLSQAPVVRRLEESTGLFGMFFE